ncbi:hypothetical protein ACFXTH_002069 [Malus domestica]
MDRDSSAGGWNSFGEKMVGNSTIPYCSPVRVIELFVCQSCPFHGRVDELWLAVGMCRNPFRPKWLVASARGWKLGLSTLLEKTSLTGIRFASRVHG